MNRRFLFCLMVVLAFSSYVSQAFSAPLQIGIVTTDKQYEMPERKLIYNNGTLIAYFNNQTYVGYRFSVDDGASWSTNYTHLVKTEESKYSVRTYNVSGVCYIYTAFVNTSIPSAVYFRRDTMYSSTRIVQGTAYQAGAGGSVADYPDVEVDDAGNVYVCCGFRQETGLQKRIFAKWMRCTSNDGSGTWVVWNAQTRAAAPYVSSSGGDDLNCRVSSALVRLASTKVYVIYFSAAKGNLVNGSIWNGVNQWANESIITDTTTTILFSVAPYSSHVLFSYSNYSAAATGYYPWLKYRNGTSDTWSSPEKCSTNKTKDATNICVNATNGDAWIVFEGGNTTSFEKVNWVKRTWATKTYGNTGNLTKKYTDGMYEFSVQTLINQVHTKLMIIYAYFIVSPSTKYLMFISESLAGAAAPTTVSCVIGCWSRTYASRSFWQDKTASFGSWQRTYATAKSTCTFPVATGASVRTFSSQAFWRESSPTLGSLTKVYGTIEVWRLSESTANSWILVFSQGTNSFLLPQYVFSSTNVLNSWFYAWKLSFMQKGETIETFQETEVWRELSMQQALWLRLYGKDSEVVQANSVNTQLMQFYGEPMFWRESSSQQSSQVDLFGWASITKIIETELIEFLRGENLKPYAIPFIESDTVGYFALAFLFVLLAIVVSILLFYGLKRKSDSD